MGRRDAVQATLEFAAEWRRLGARVTYEPGWERRGNGLQANYEGCSVHHTGYGSSAAKPFPARADLVGGRPDLSGPLCNSAGPWCADGDPWIHVIAAFPANHGGASGGRGTAPFPVTSLFNPLSWGHEIDYGGNVPMSNGQRLAALIVARGVTNVLRKDTSWAKAHAETSITGKWDPGYAKDKTIDMAAFRRDAAALSSGRNIVATLDAEDLRNIHDAVHFGAPGARLLPVERWNENGEWTGTTLGSMLARIDRDIITPKIAELQKQIGELSGTSADKTAPVSLDAAAVAAALAKDTSFLAGLAKAVNDDAARRLAS